MENSAGTEIHPRPCVLVVDDEQDNRTLAKEILNHQGYDVLLAENGQAALCVYRQHRDRINGVILDLVMPKMGGGETLLALRRENPKIPVLLVSGYSEKEEIRRFLSHENVDFLGKPFTLSALAERVRHVMAPVGN